jgi:hypothetical protein
VQANVDITDASDSDRARHERRLTVSTRNLKSQRSHATLGRSMMYDAPGSLLAPDQRRFA